MLPNDPESRTLPAPDDAARASGAAGISGGTRSGTYAASAENPQNTRSTSNADQTRIAEEIHTAVTRIRHGNKTRGEMVRCALILCPELPQGTRFAFVSRGQGPCDMKIDAGTLIDKAPSLNLARLRQRGAQLGAKHVVLILPQGYVFSLMALP